MIATVPIDLALNVAVGSSVAYASRFAVGQYTLLRSPALWALLAFEALVFVPVGGYLLWRFPAWSLMYLVEAGSLPVPDAALCVGYPIFAIAAFLVCRQMVLRRHWGVALTVVVAALAATLAMLYLGRDHLLVLGTTEAFRDDPTQMREAIESELAWVVAAAGAAVTVGWGATVWRLSLLGRAARAGHVVAAAAVSEPTDRKSARRGTKRTKKRTK